MTDEQQTPDTAPEATAPAAPSTTTEADHAWEDSHADALAQDAEFAIGREHVAERDEGRAESLYARKPSAGEREAAEQKQQEAAKDTAENTRSETHTRAAVTAGLHVEAIKSAAPEFQGRLQKFQHGLAQIAQLTDPVQRKLAEQHLRGEAQWLEQRHQQIRESSFAAEQGRMLAEAPGLSDAGTRRQLVSWARSKGVSTREIENASPEQVLKAYRAWRAETAAAKRVADEAAGQKAERKAEKRRVAALPMHVRVAEMKGQPNAALMLYGDAAARRAHRLAVQKRLT